MRNNATNKLPFIGFVSFQNLLSTNYNNPGQLAVHQSVGEGEIRWTLQLNYRHFACKGFNYTQLREYDF